MPIVKVDRLGIESMSLPPNGRLRHERLRHGDGHGSTSARSAAFCGHVRRMTCPHISAGVRDGVLDEYVLESGHVAGPCCVEEGCEQAMSLSWVITLVPCSAMCARALRPSCRAQASLIPSASAISRNGYSNASRSTKTARSVGDNRSSRSRTASARSTDISAASVGSSEAGTRSGSQRSTGISRRTWAEATKLSVTRVVIVTRNATRSRTCARSAPFQRTHTSWTTSSASATRPSIRYAIANRRGRILWNSVASSDASSAIRPFEAPPFADRAPSARVVNRRGSSHSRLRPSVTSLTRARFRRRTSAWGTFPSGLGCPVRRSAG